MATQVSVSSCVSFGQTPKKYSEIFFEIFFGLIAIVAGVLIGFSTSSYYDMHLAQSLEPIAAVAATPQVIVDSLDPSLDSAMPAWKTEIGRRFSNAVGILVHGGDPVEHDWSVHTAPYNLHIENLIRAEQARYPGRTLVILACNPHHNILHGFPNVYYFPSSVWTVPDRALQSVSFATSDKTRFDKIDPAPAPITIQLHITCRSDEDPDTCGNIFEAIEAK